MWQDPLEVGKREVDSIKGNMDNPLPPNSSHLSTSGAGCSSLFEQLLEGLVFSPSPTLTASMLLNLG